MTLLAPLLALAVAAVPAFRAAGAEAAALERDAAAAWQEIEARAGAAGLTPVSAPRPVRIQLAPALAPGVAGTSVPGITTLRWAAPDRVAAALRHEVAHQLLWQACPPATDDRLFHEVFALWAAGEVGAWSDGGYLSTSAATRQLRAARTLDTPSARKALARLLAESSRAGAVPPALATRFGRCDPGARWNVLAPEDLDGEPAAADALVALSRHSGEVLVEEGAARSAMPTGSTLKPFVVAAATAAPPRLPPRAGHEAWAACGRVDGPMDVATALARSCNGWFLEWLEASPEPARLGAWRGVLAALGVERLPERAAEAIGLVPDVTIAPIALAHAYRLLAESRPDLVDVLRRTPVDGTLANLAVSAALRGVALKTGTVRDAAGAPRLGWIVAVDDGVVWVMARRGRAPREFARDLVRARAHAPPGRDAVEVQVLGLVDRDRVEARCEGAGFVAGEPSPVRAGFAPLAESVRRGAGVCLGGSWLIRFPGGEPRRYAGVFRLSPPPPIHSAEDVPVRAQRARRGSDFVFRTTRLAYVAGVVQAEDAAIRGAARTALARVVAHNADRSRHGGRPPCDTTHCQAFRGTVAARQEEREAVASPRLARAGWLAFSRGGDEPWTERRRVGEVDRVLAPGVRDLAFGDGAVRFTASFRDRDSTWEERRSIPCELLRGPLRLPACPASARRDGAAFVFEGRGAGHGEGLDLERAKRSGQGADALLREAYGPMADGWGGPP